MRKTTILLLGTAFLMVSFAPPISYSQENQYKKGDQDWAILDKPNFSIQYPTTWELEENNGQETLFTLFSALTDNDRFKENINLMTQDLSGYNLNLDDFTKLSESQIKDRVKNSILLKSARIKSSNKSGGVRERHLIEYTGNQGHFLLHWKQYCWVVRQKAYVLTFTAEEKNYEKYISVVNQIINSFTLKV